MSDTIIAIEFVFDLFILILAMTVFIIFSRYLFLNSFMPGEAKKIFELLTVFVGILFLSFLSTDVLEIAHVLGVHKAPLTEELEETADLIAHILQTISLCILFYISVIFSNFAKKLKKARM